MPDSLSNDLRRRVVWLVLRGTKKCSRNWNISGCHAKTGEQHIVPLSPTRAY